MLKRKIYNYLKSFFKEDKKALLITGARQVGKTYAIREVGKKCFKNFVEFNFVVDPGLKAVFAKPKDVNTILLRLSSMSKANFEKGKTLIFFDEVQECPEVVTAIKFLVDEGSFRYVMSGSLLGVELNDLRSVPIGYLAIKEMYPLDFEEFASAVGMSDNVMQHINSCYINKEPIDSVIHEKMIELHRLYLVLGGMPAVVARYLESNNMQTVKSEQDAIVNLYRKDIAKYDSDNKLYIKDIFDEIPSELNAKNKRFILKSLHDKAKFDRFRNSFIWLADAGVALPTYNIEEPCIPLRLNSQRNLFKLFLNDVGLLSSLFSTHFQQQVLFGDTNINYGAIFENYAAQELKAHGYELFYFNSKKQGELDFVIEHDDKVLPIEIKSGKDYKRHSALTNVLENEAYDIPTAIVFSQGNIEIGKKIVYMPIYMLMYLKPSEFQTPIYTFMPM